MDSQSLEEEGRGRVLVVDGGASMRCALLGDNIAEMAYKNGWSVRTQGLTLLRSGLSSLKGINRHSFNSIAEMSCTDMWVPSCCLDPPCRAGMAHNDGWACAQDVLNPHFDNRSCAATCCERHA